MVIVCGHKIDLITSLNYKQRIYEIRRVRQNEVIFADVSFKLCKPYVQVVKTCNIFKVVFWPKILVSLTLSQPLRHERRCRRHTIGCKVQPEPNPNTVM